MIFAFAARLFKSFRRCRGTFFAGRRFGGARWFVFSKSFSPTRRAVLKAFGVAEVLFCWPAGLGAHAGLFFLNHFRLRGERVCLQAGFGFACWFWEVGFN